MLTSDLLRFKTDDRTISPRYLTRKHADYYLKIAGDLIAIFQQHQGNPRSALEQALDAYEEDRVGYKILRGLAKILDGFSEYEPAEEFDYPEFRKQFFEYVEQFRPVVRQADLVHRNTRKQVVAKYRAQNPKWPLTLYGDLPEQQILVKLNQHLAAEDVIRRYNLALAQGLLYRCYLMEIKVWDSYKTVFKYLKLAGLIHKIRKVEAAYQITVDGPFSLFRRTQKYGVNLARFLPGLMLAKKWQMWAQVRTDSGERLFYLDQDCGLHSHYKAEHPFDSAVEEAFHEQFGKRKTAWEIHRENEIVDFGDSVLIPDFKFTHPDGHEVLLEIVGFWTPEYLQKKLEKLARVKQKNFVVAVNASLNCSKSDFNGPVLFYKTRIKTGEVLKILEEMRAQPSTE
ncbi:MAG: DUF790 family protein [bacterium]